jgi:hypothetical protein
MNLKNIKTRNNKQVVEATIFGDRIIGLVDNKLIQWDMKGRRSPKRFTALDLVEENNSKMYVVVRNWNGNFKYTVVPSKPRKKKSIVKIVEVSL